MSIRVPVEYDTDASGLDRQLSGDMSKAGRKAGSSFSSGFKKLVGPLAGIAAGAVVGDFLHDSLSEARESQKVAALSAQVIKSTGGAANVTAKQMEELAGAISRKTAIDDEQIQSSENLLATFTNIKNGAQAQNKIFDKATSAAVDLAAGLAAVNGGEVNLKTATTLVGKALDDPIKGLTALTRVGIRFTDQQKKRIKGLVDEGKTMEAQRIILGRLEKKFGGAAASQVTSADKARQALRELEEQVGTALLPVIDDLADAISKDVIPAVSDFITEFQNGTGTAGDIKDALSDVVEIGKEVFQFFDSLPAPVKKFATEGLILYGTLVKIKSIAGPLGTAISTFATGIASAETRTAALGTAAKGLAGAGGLTLLATSMNETNQDAKVLESTVGGLATGFALGGPIGAAVGGLGGFVTAMLSGNAATKHGVRQLGDYGAALDVTTGKLKKNAIAQIIAEAQKDAPDLFLAASALGIRDKQIAQYILGNKKVVASIDEILALQDKLPLSDVTTFQTRLEDGTKARLDAFSVLTKALKGSNVETSNGIKFVKGIAGTYQEQAAQVRKTAAQLRIYQAALAQIPKKVSTLITNDKSGDVSLAQIEALQDKYNLNPKTVKTLIKLEGLTPSIRDMNTLLDRGKTLGKSSWRPKVDGSSIHHAYLEAFNLVNLINLASRGIPLPGKPASRNGSVPSKPRIVTPSSSPSIVPRVSSSPSVASSTVAPVTIIQNYNGPTTGRARLAEIEWSLRYSTRARAV